jgi:HD-GYP domain-containing protein (c-di-GMP phosphodiesterase class II)
MRGLPPAVWAYVGGVVATAAAFLGTGSYAHPHWRTFAVLTVLFLVCDSAPALLLNDRVRVSMSYSVGLASVVLLGPVWAALVGASALVTVHRDRVPIYKRLFNAAQFALCCYSAGVVYQTIGPSGIDERQVTKAIGPFVLADVTYAAVNLLLIGGILLLTGQIHLRGARLGPIIQLAAGYVGYGMFGLLIAGTWQAIDLLAAVLVLLPLFIARWAFSQTRAQQEAYDATIAALCQAVETKDYYTRGHSERVSRGSVMIAEEIGMRAERVNAIRYAGMLHDVGKLGVPTKVLQKAGGLTDEEYAAVQLHPMRGLEIVREIGFLDEALNGIMHHHEKVDGTGYPMGLAGEEIPEFARVISVADVFDTLTSKRSYRSPWTIEKAVAELRRSAGSHFDPEMVEAFLRALDRVGWEPPEAVVVPEGEEGVQTTQQDHDDPTAPLRIVVPEQAAPDDDRADGQVSTQ